MENIIEAKLKLYKNCKDIKKKRLLHISIIEETIPLVKKIANSISLPYEIPAEDLIQVGSIGLIKAIEFFDVNKNVKFRTYATHFIRGEIKHYLRDKSNMIKAPRELQELVFKISSTIKEFKNQGFEDISEEQISDAIGIDVSKVHEVMELELCKSILSLDQTVTNTDEDDFMLIDKIPSGDYQEFINSRENIIMLKEAMNKLPDELRKIVELCYLQDMNQREVSEYLNISQMQVSRKLKKALSKLYEMISKSD